MGLFNRRRSEPPAQKVEPVLGALPVEVENSTQLSSIEELGEALGIVNSLAGPVVNSKTAMRLAIVYGCARLISGAIATMPVHVYRKTSDGRERDTGHPLGSLLNLQPTPLMSAAVFWELITASMLLEGDGHCVIIRDVFGVPEEILPIWPGGVIDVQRRGNRLQYFIQLDDKDLIRGFDQDDVLHFPGFGFNGRRSLSVIKYAALNSIGLSMAMEQFSSEFFKNGAHQDVVVTKSGKWSAEDQDNFREAWQRTYGGIANGRKPLTVSQGLSVSQLSVNAEDSQLLESREFENINICTAFGIPGFLVNQGKNVTAWGTGMAEQGMAFVRYCLMPHMVRFQQELNRKLLVRTESFVEFSPAGLLRGTQKERNEAYKSALGGSNVPGYMAINEVRRLENMPPLENDVYNQPYDPRLVPPEQRVASPENKP